MKLKRLAVSALLPIMGLALSIPTEAQRRGDTARVTIGTVDAMRKIKFDDGSGGGALLGGAAGWAIARNQSSGRQAAAAIAGAGIGAASRQNRYGGTGMEYRVRNAAGDILTIVSDQTEVRIGDCVSVEETGKTANIRRVDNDLCTPAAPVVIETVAPVLAEEAARCSQAKDRLFAATTAEEVEVARQIMEAFCND
ncbi:MAG: hypothetical protein V2J89_14690 [Halieaceae bacterium]|jgi:outer membrane lipoprotein SlyB|nr:hypothetical protein [Halieaceae bacterium]